MDPEKLYLEHRSFIEETLAQICERYHVTRADRDDLVSTAHVHMVRDDYRVFRAYEGRAPLRVYLLAVLRQLFQDWRNAQWGRWRPSASARRLGPHAIVMEQLCFRDGHTPDEAVTLAVSNYGVKASPDQLRHLLSLLPPRTPRVFVSDQLLRDHPGGDESEALIEAEEADRVAVALDRALAALPHEDRVLLRLRFEQEISMAALARIQGTDYQFTYRRLTRVLAGLRGAMEATGISAHDAASVLMHRGLALREERPS